MDSIRWGILSTAKIGTEKVIPAMQQCQYGTVAAIASRDLGQAQAAAQRLGIGQAYGSYDDLLADPSIDAIYNPLPNHLHVPWSIKALQAGKHVLCEKPIGLSVAEAETLREASAQFPHLKVMEAFMYRRHPQWQRAIELVRNDGIGTLRTVNAVFSYFNNDPANVRNQSDIGGGGVMDIGCYCISLSRWVFGREPRRVCSWVEYDPQFGTDRLASALMDFGDGTATWTCSTQMTSYQRVNIFGTKGRIEIEIPFNAPPDKPCRLWYEHNGTITEETFAVVDQYTLQGDAFARAILDDTPVPTSIDDAVANMRVIEAVFSSASTNDWVALGE